MQRSIVYVVDNDPDFHRAVHVHLQRLDVSVESSCALEKLLSNRQSPSASCLVLGLEKGEDNISKAMIEIRTQQALLPVIAVCAEADVPTAVAAMKAGVLDFLEKPIDGETLRNCVEIALRRNERLQRHWNDPALPDGQLKTLTAQERDVIDGIAAGQQIRSIARHLDISMRTVHNRRATAMRKLGARNRAELVRIVAAPVM